MEKKDEHKPESKEEEYRLEEEVVEEDEYDKFSLERPQQGPWKYGPMRASLTDKDGALF